MNTGYKIFIILAIITTGFVSIPPTLSSVCNMLEIYDERCPRIAGIQTPFGVLVIWNTMPPTSVDVHSSNGANAQNDFFMDNVTRHSVIHIGYKQHDMNRLGVNMTQDLVIAGHTNYVALWIFKTTWHTSQQADAEIVVLEDENHKKIMMSENVGTFQQVIKVHIRCGDDNILFIPYYSAGSVPMQGITSSKIFVKYIFPDLLPDAGMYRLNFSSPYPVQFEFPSNFKVTYNYTKVCSVTYTKPHPNVFSYDLMFKTK